jgi:hypothetical protein
VVIQICFQKTSLDATERYVPKWNHASNNLILLTDSHAQYLKQLISYNKLQMDGQWLVHCSNETLRLQLAKQKYNFQPSDSFHFVCRVPTSLSLFVLMGDLPTN